MWPKQSPPREPVDKGSLAARIQAWNLRAGVHYKRLQKRLDQNGFYSLIEKEIIPAQQSLEEGRQLSQASRTSLALMAQLQAAVFSAQAKCQVHKEQLNKDRSWEEKWRALGFDEEILEKHADCARFLFQSKLIYSISGYLQTCKDPHMHGVRRDADGHPLIKVQGRFTRWEHLKPLLQYDSREDVIKSKGSDGIEQKWSYFHEGLIPVDRFNSQQFPVYQISPSEYSALLSHAKRFYEGGEVSEKPCIVQLYTTERRQGIPNLPYLANFHSQIPVHAAMRVILPDGKVYSFGIEMLYTEQNKIIANLFSASCMTTKARIAVLDYEEFKLGPEDKRWVTSIPVSVEMAKAVLQRVDEINKEYLRFNFAKQNCTRLPEDVLSMLGIDVNLRTTIPQSVWNALPDLDQLPVLGDVVKKIHIWLLGVWEEIVADTPYAIRQLFSWTGHIVCYLPRKCLIIFTNLILYKLGASKSTTPLPQGVKDEAFYDKRKVQNFSTVIRSWKDVFSEETYTVGHSNELLKWQKKQASTQLFEPGRPQLCLICY